ncbi:response regulator [Leptolyngbya sp. KIOST-1]|uniref:response regulator n=1 Tax=Leptolyngbya sp. KIOST-1 TaxID=1229172 RepID=UPI0005694540|nr:response regulator [Leptolyngbya sp. KIOST-1]
MRILLVDDDELLAQTLADFLISQHYAVDWVTDGEMGWDYAQAATYDLIVLDVNLPQVDGVRLCQQLRQSQYGGPILLLTAKGDSADKVMGLDAGADDYLVKPCTLDELSARIRALLRRPTAIANPLLQWGDLCLNPGTCEVSYRGQPLALSPKEYSLLELFLRHPQQVFSSSVILEHLWSFSEIPGEETVRTHIKRLRRKLKAVGAEQAIDTVYGMGYRLQTLPDSPTAPDPVPVGDQARQAVVSLWETLRAPILKRLSSLEQAVAALQTGPLTDPLRQTAAVDAHKLSGSLGMFGFAEGSRLSQEIERWLATPEEDEDGDQLRSRVEALRQELERSPTAPVTPVSQPVVLPLTPPPGPRLGEPQPPSGPSKVLVLDDDDTILATVQQLLAHWGIQTVILNDPLQLWPTLASELPDLLILDVDMPHLNGIEVCQLLRDDDTWNGLPILFLTAHRHPEVILQLYSAGADDYVGKPFTEPELVTRIFNRIERNRLLQAWRKPSQPLSSGLDGGGEY